MDEVVGNRRDRGPNLHATEPPDRPQRPVDSVRIRPARTDDLHRIVEVETECYTIPWSPRAFRSLLDRAHVRVLVAEVAADQGGDTADRDSEYGRRVVAHGVLWHIDNEAELANLAVERRHRRRGIAARLLDQLLEDASKAGVESVFLEVRESNEAAIALYLGRGFRQVGVRRHYYERPREDARILRRGLARDGNGQAD